MLTPESNLKTINNLAKANRRQSLERDPSSSLDLRDHLTPAHVILRHQLLIMTSVSSLPRFHAKKRQHQAFLSRNHNTLYSAGIDHKLVDAIAGKAKEQAHLFECVEIQAVTENPGGYMEIMSDDPDLFSIYLRYKESSQKISEDLIGAHFIADYTILYEALLAAQALADYLGISIDNAITASCSQ